MIIFLAGAIHGQLDAFYERVAEIETTMGLAADWIIQTGNLGVWPNPERMDAPTRKRGSPSDFSNRYHGRISVPRPTLFVAGKHEDHKWLKLKMHCGEMELLPGLHWLVNGYRTLIGDSREQLSVVGLGKVYSPAAYAQKPEAKRKSGHYTRHEVRKACSHGPTDIVLTHEAPAGEVIGGIRSEAKGINNICFATRPKLLVHSHYTTDLEYKTRNPSVQAISLAPMSIVPIEYRRGRFYPID